MIAEDGYGGGDDSYSDDGDDSDDNDEAYDNDDGNDVDDHYDDLPCSTIMIRTIRIVLS